jgi:hypothetical protein
MLEPRISVCFIGSSDLKRKKYIVLYSAVDNFYFGSADLKRKKYCAIYTAVDNFYFLGNKCDHTGSDMHGPLS